MSTGGQLTVDMLKRVVPKSIKANISEELVDEINALNMDQEEREHFRENLLSYTGVLADGKFKIQSYIDAVRYVSNKLLGQSNIVAYTNTFPDRYQRFMDAGKTREDISSFVAAYNRNKLVNLVFAQTMIPTHVLNQDLYQKAINTQAELMIHAKSEKVRTDAANSLLTHLKPPEAQKIDLNIGMKPDKTIEDLRDATAQLVQQQKKMLETGLQDVQEVAHSRLIIEGEFEEAS